MSNIKGYTIQDKISDDENKEGRLNKKYVIKRNSYGISKEITSDTSLKYSSLSSSEDNLSFNILLQSIIKKINLVKNIQEELKQSFLNLEIKFQNGSLNKDLFLSRLNEIISDEELREILTDKNISLDMKKSLLYNINSYSELYEESKKDLK